MKPLVKWYCPKCGTTTKQFASVPHVWHTCTKNNNRETTFEKEEDDNG